MAKVFVGREALASGLLTRHELQRWYRPIFRGIYTPRGVVPTLRDRTTAAWLASDRRAVVAGVAASALHGAPWVDADVPIELISQRARPQHGLIVRTVALGDDEITWACKLPVTTRLRTAFDLGRYLPREEAIARLDALMRTQIFSIEDVQLLAKRYRGAGCEIVEKGSTARRGWRRFAEGDLAAAALHRRWIAPAHNSNTGM
jgi:hypothetical protein